MQVPGSAGERRSFAKQHVKRNRCGARVREPVHQPGMQTPWPARRHRWQGDVGRRRRPDDKVQAAMKPFRVSGKGDVGGGPLTHDHHHDVVGWLYRTAQLEKPRQPDVLLQVANRRNPKQGGADSADRDAGCDRLPPGLQLCQPTPRQSTVVASVACPRPRVVQLRPRDRSKSDQDSPHSQTTPLT